MADGELDAELDGDDDADAEGDDDGDDEAEAEGEDDADADGELEDSARTSCVPMSVSIVNMYLLVILLYCVLTVADF